MKNKKNNKKKNNDMHSEDMSLWGQSSKDLICVVFFIREEFRRLKKINRFNSWSESWSNLPESIEYQITLMTGEVYEIQISFLPDSKKSSWVFKNVSSRKDTLHIHTEIPVADLKKIIKKTIIDSLFKRTRGFNTEYLALRYLQSVIENKQSDLIVKVRKAFDYEDILRKDIVMECMFQDKLLTVSFDLKNNQQAIADAIENRSKTPTIFTNEDELKKTPEKFLDRVHELIVVMFRSEVFDIEAGKRRAAIHIGAPK